MGEIERFQEEVRDNIRGLSEDTDLQGLSRIWIRETAPHKYSYNFSWLGRPIIQFPQDMVAMQELIWNVRPELIIETGIAHGGSLIFNASILELIGGEGRVLGVDIDIREHNREALEAHPMFKRIDMIQGSSIADDIVEQVRERAEGKSPIIVALDSNHTHDHVLEELRLYSPLVTKGSYLVISDTIVEDMPEDLAVNDRPWGKGNNPKTAVRQFLQETDRFEIDTETEGKLLITVAPEGYLRCVKD